MRGKAEDIEEAERLRAAGEKLLEAYAMIFPGIKHIAVQDYALINEAPIEMRRAINGETNGSD